MARNLQVYPKAFHDGLAWRVSGKVDEFAAGTSSRFEHVVPAGVTAEVPLQMLKVVFDLTDLEDTDTHRDVDDALFDDDIKPGPTKETVWSNWQALAEGIISGLSSGYTQADFTAAWSKDDTEAVRDDANRALVSPQGRGWTITFFHQHEGDGTVTDGP